MEYYEYEDYRNVLAEYNKRLTKMSILLFLLSVLVIVLTDFFAPFLMIWIFFAVSMIGALIQAAKDHKGFEAKISFFWLMLIVIGGGIVDVLNNPNVLYGQMMLFSFMLIGGVGIMYAFQQKKGTRNNRYLMQVAYPMNALLTYVVKDRPDIETYEQMNSDYE